MDVWGVTERKKDQCRAEKEHGSGGHSGRGEEKQTAMVRTEENDWVKKVMSINLEGTRPSGRPKKTWQTTVLADMKALGINHDVAKDRSRWKKAISRDQSNPAVPGKRTLNRR